LLRLVTSLGALFALLASAMAFLITWQEYSRHFHDRKKALRLALRSAVVAFLFFVVLSVVAGLAISRIMGAKE
jgi:uncharacterized membrane protein SpoIIM required for sporulation